jgi:hypothetical protein
MSLSFHATQASERKWAPVQANSTRCDGLLCRATVHGAADEGIGELLCRKGVGAACTTRRAKATAGPCSGRACMGLAREGAVELRLSTIERSPIEASSSKEVEFLWSSSSFFLHFALVQFKGRKEQAQTWNWPQMVLKILSKYYWFLCKT